MRRSCNGICGDVLFKKLYDVTRINRNAFINGYYRCRECEVFIKGLRICPCCNDYLSMRPRNNKSRRSLIRSQEVVRH